MNFLLNITKKNFIAVNTHSNFTYFNQLSLLNNKIKINNTLINQIEDSFINENIITNENNLEETLPKVEFNKRYSQAKKKRAKRKTGKQINIRYR